MSGNPVGQPPRASPRVYMNNSLADGLGGGDWDLTKSVVVAGRSDLATAADWLQRIGGGRQSLYQEDV